MRFSSRFFPAYLTTVVVALLSACGDSGNGNGGSDDCSVGAEGCACTDGGSCDAGLACRSRLCVDLAGAGDGNGDGDGDTNGDGDGDTNGDGDGNNPGDGDGDGDATGGTGQGTGGSSGDGDLGGAPGDGDGDVSGGASAVGCDAERIVLPVTYRDFNSTHPDFISDEVVQSDPCEGLTSGIVESTLGPSGKPVFSGPDESCLTRASFEQWFTDSNESSTIESTLVLFPDGQGGHVNRMGPSGEQYEAAPEGELRICGNVGQFDGCQAASDAGYCAGPDFDPSTETCWQTGANGNVDITGQPLPYGCCSNCFCAGTITIPKYDGTPLFFPLDGHPDALDDARHPARLPAQYYNAIGWPWETGGPELNPPEDSPLHNFHFTSELDIPFQYRPSEEAVLTLLADDDAFVFVNGHLVLDLGGYHIPLVGVLTLSTDGSVHSRIWLPRDPGVNSSTDTTLSESTVLAGDLGLEGGNRYEIQIFDAERKPSGSSFLLSLSGFDVNEACAP